MAPEMSTIRATSKSEHGGIPPPNDASFQQFTTLKAADLRRIASATRREYRTEDVIHEAWLMAYDFDNKMATVADHLRISRSHAYRCCAKAQWLSAYAMHIPIPIDEHFLPGPWRSFRLHRPQIQLTLDFGDERLI
jgi:hypothetical protein